MAKLDELWRTGVNDYRHPVLEFLNKLGTDVEAAVGVYRAGGGLGLKPAQLYLHVRVDGREESPREYTWDDELNTALIERGIKAVSANDEKERFALLLRSGFRKPEVRFGDGFFNAVLGLYVRDSGFAEFGEVADVLRDIHTNEPYKGGGSYETCNGMVDQVVRQAAALLSGPLHYSREDSKEILAGALARYLDERFTVSDRRRLGWT